MKDITQVMAEVVQSIRDAYETDHPFFMYGFRKEISGKLMAKDRDRINKFLKYPLIVLWLNAPGTVENGMIHYSLNLGIYHRSQMEIDSVKRMANVIRPILEPVYRQLIEALGHYEMYWDGDLTVPPHIKVASPYGQQERGGVVKNIFGDPVDAIEINDLRVSLLETCDELTDFSFVPRPPEFVAENSFVFYEDGKWTTITLEELAVKIADTPI